MIFSHVGLFDANAFYSLPRHVTKVRFSFRLIKLHLKLMKLEFIDEILARTALLGINHERNLHVKMIVEKYSMPIS